MIKNFYKIPFSYIVKAIKVILLKLTKEEEMS